MQNNIRIIAACLALALTACSANKKMGALKNNLPMLVFDKEGHRGCRGLMPENTIPAMLKAIDLGVTTLEMDIVFTKDKVAVLSHEPFFNHDITTKPDGKYIEEKDEKTFNIYQMNFAETRRYDVGIKPHPRFATQQKLKATKPSLASLIDSVELYLTSHNLPKVYYNIETKTNPATDNIYHPAPAEFVALLMVVIKSKGIEERVIIQSFDFRTLQILHVTYPTIKTAMLIEAYDKRTLDEQIEALGFTPTIYSPENSLVNKALIDACHSKKIKIIPWTVNERTQIEELKKLGVDGIISDYPNLMKNQ
ncbi:MAG: glycerophosphodiester phosphodiesterase [Aquabacterium sp.]|nr:glycerophosphodiester phosphodiesterase [Ferruginibacter sp.]